jgi:hypothetical protein
MTEQTYSKMYIAVLDEAPDYMVPTLVAHSVLTAHVKFAEPKRLEFGQPSNKEIYLDWMQHSFRKVTLRVNRREFDKIRETLTCHQGHENTICNGEPSCLVVLPVRSDNVPNVLKYAKLWKPITGE